ncbi:major capsid protein [Parvibaculum sp.]|uniref:major capsid protein n=1 Tax=Parvibaculum sp. TaxID=2024848 RepID=UPI0027315402|nr:major capsid protein [Parvibaculum sp.]MDP1628853.1 major capsid protein [Parvibaculum sp.]MDP2148248.1 major capsid protein [Parvibaculum sp.]MDP3327860.1 major capsid protein [Parvibaculum sp.]
MLTINTASGPINFAYTARDLTMAIDVLPNLYGRLNQENLFPSEGVRTKLVEVRFRNGYITVLPVADRGGAPSVGKGPDENAVYLEIPHVPHLDYLTPDDIQDMYAFGANPLRLKTPEDALNEKLQAIRNKHSITREYFRMGALKGVVKDGNGSTLHDLFERFGIVKKTIDFELDDANTDVKAKCRELIRFTKRNLKGEVMGKVRMKVDPVFFDMFTGHPNVEKFFLNYVEARSLAVDDVTEFPFGGLILEEYDATVTLMDGSTEELIAEGYGHAYPTGTMNTFRTFDGPPHSMSMANMPGAEIYISPKLLDHDEGIELKSQSNPLPVVSRPDLIVEALAA